MLESELKEVLKPINQCKYTGLEKRVPSSVGFGFNVVVLESQVNNCKIVRLLLKESNKFISGLLIKKHHLESHFTIDTRYTLEEHRKQDYAKGLLTVARLKYGNVKHSEHLTELGAKSI